MGVVLKGYQRELNRYVAIKVMAPHYAGSSAARKRFVLEAQAELEQMKESRKDEERRPTKAAPSKGPGGITSSKSRRL